MEHVAVSDTDMSQFARINDDAAPHSYSLTDDVEIHNHRAILDSCDIGVRKTGPDQNQKLKPFHLQLIAESNIVHL